MPDPLGAASQRSAEAPAVVGPGLGVTYGELEAQVRGAAAGLAAHGCRPGDTVAFYLPHGVPLLVLLVGAMRAGAVACPLSTRLPAGGVAGQLRQAGCRLLVTREAPEAGAGVRVLRPEALLGGTAPVDVPETVPLDRPATLLFTSGSAGAPKAALHTYGNHYFNALGSNSNIRLGPGDRWLLSLPLYHVGGLGIVFRCLLAGAALVLPDSRAPLGEVLRREAVTHASLVATQLLRLLREEGPGAPGLKAVLLGGSALPPALVEEARRRGLPVHTSYGLTEMASQVTTTPPGAAAETLRSAGMLLPYRALRLTPEGEICVRGETRFAGYLEEGALRRPFDGDGWFHTGDLGYLDAAGRLHVAGRRDNLFISGGENIQPEEVEQALCRLDGVAQAVVVPAPDAEFGFRPVAFVRGEGGLRPVEWTAALAETLPRFKLPVAYHPWPDDLPEGMKVDRRGLQARLGRNK